MEFALRIGSLTESMSSNEQTTSRDFALTVRVLASVRHRKGAGAEVLELATLRK